MAQSRFQFSLAAGTLPEARPDEVILAAADAGFEYVGLRVDGIEWCDEYLEKLVSLLRKTRISVLDVEVIWIRPGALSPQHFEILDIASALGAPNVLVVSSDPDMAQTIAKFDELCDYGAPRGLSVNLEFGRFTEVPDLESACKVLESTAAGNKGLLVDTLHLCRSGGCFEALATLPEKWFKYIQLCDGSGPAPVNFEEIVEEALDGRSCPGEGELPLSEIVGNLPKNLPVSLEIRSKVLREKFPDFSERAKFVFRKTINWAPIVAR